MSSSDTSSQLAAKLFVNVSDSSDSSHTSNSSSSYPPIVLIDASGSVRGKFNGASTIIEQIEKIVGNLNANEFRILFWNSNHDPASWFKGGVYLFPMLVKKQSLRQFFSVVVPNIAGNCLTYPHLGFENIPVDWINKSGPTKIYFVTDGEIGYASCPLFELGQLKTKLAEAIQRLFMKFNAIQLNILTVEAVDRDYTKAESLVAAAGCDVYNVIMSNRLTQYISKFVSYAPSNLSGFIHINKIIAPPGHLSFGEKYFSELRIGDFIRYLKATIHELCDDSKETTDGMENKLITIVQNLSPTLCKLTKDKPARLIAEIIQTFCSLFNRTMLDPTFVKLILVDAVQKENAGMANIFATYRAQLKDLFKKANEMLFSSVRDAVRINDGFVTFPIANTVVSGNYRLVDKNVCIGSKVYPQAAISVDNLIIPVMPLFNDQKSAINEQCMRQWTRTVMGHLFKVNFMDDTVIHLVLGVVLQVVLSDVDDGIKNNYRKLGVIMLQKMRLNTNMTELDRLLTGELPTPNSGKIAEFYGFMEVVKNKLGITLPIQPMSLWYMLCLALGNETLISKQFSHCKHTLDMDFKDIKEFDRLSHEQVLQLMRPHLPAMKHMAIPNECLYDYTQCLITLEDTSKTGGYKFLQHTSLTGSICSPMYILSDEGYQTLIKSPSTSLCPICYTTLEQKQYEKVGPKPAVSTHEFFFDKQLIQRVNIFSSLVATDAFKEPEKKQEKDEKTQSKGNEGSIDRPGIIISLRGTVGAGKSTWSSALKAEIEKQGGYCIVEGTDKYCKNGMAPRDACQLVTTELQKAKLVENKLKIVVIDTCGENFSPKSVFGVDFSSWKKIMVQPNFDKTKMVGYLAWSLRNVLQRKVPTADDNYYLNPMTAGLDTCLAVHAKKVKSLFGKKTPSLFVNPPTTVQDAIDTINQKAEEYKSTLADTDSVIQKFISTQL